MSEKHLLLSPAKRGVIVWTPKHRGHVRWFLFAVGVCVILVGAASVFSRVAENTFGSDAVGTAFAPLGTVNLAMPPKVATSTPLVPAHVDIPSIGVSAKVKAVGKNADGSMATPGSFVDVAWYSLGSKPGEAGNAVLAGHVNNALGTAGVFEHLSDVQVGDYITVSDAKGKTLVYVVFENDQYPADQAPSASIFSGTGPSQLVLITCDGVWDAAAHSYTKRFVVYAQLSSR